MPRTDRRARVDVEDLRVRVKNGAQPELGEVAREVAALAEQGRLGEDDDEDGLLVPALLARLAGTGDAEVRVLVMAALRRLAGFAGGQSKEFGKHQTTLYLLSGWWSALEVQMEDPASIVRRRGSRLHCAPPGSSLHHAPPYTAAATCEVEVKDAMAGSRHSSELRGHESSQSPPRESTGDRARPPRPSAVPHRCSGPRRSGPPELCRQPQPPCYAARPGPISSGERSDIVKGQRGEVHAFVQVAVLQENFT